MHTFLGGNTYSKIRTKVFKGERGEPIIGGTKFGWVIHGGDLCDTYAMFVGHGSDYEKLYSPDVLGVENSEEDDQLDMCREYRKNAKRDKTGRNEDNVPWIPGISLTSTKEGASRKRLDNVERKLRQNPKLEKEYSNIVKEQLEAGIIERAPEKPTEESVCFTFPTSQL